ncbi:MAG: hydroxymethylbilane synthase [Deltaproteobacteria bacterium]|nr:hydroxymethylbilane synthase [Deltaproteobacteria bacterium]
MNAPRSTLRIATRGSELALWQAHFVRDTLRRLHGDALEVELVIVTTDGDRIQDRPLHEVGGKGLFVKAIEERLLAGEAELAVHSMKDLPAELPRELVIAATPPREDPRDALVGAAGASLAELPAGTRVGTGSLRRAALVARINPTVKVMPLRGNVPTRVRKVDDGELDAVILAGAGLRRLGLHARISEFIDVERMCPSPTQGILALQCRRDDPRTQALVAPMSDPTAAVQAAAERGFLQRLQAGCTVPVGAYAELLGDEVRVRGIIVGDGGEPYFAAAERGPASEAAAIGARLAEALLDMGAHVVLSR